MANVPVVFNCAAVTAAVNDVLLPKVVVSAVPAKCTTAPSTKFLPVTVSVNGVAPTIALVCERLSSTATGFLTVKSCELEAPTPGLTTVMANVPVVFNCAAVTAAVNEVLLPKVVVSAVPAKCTTAPLTKSLPLTVNVNGVAPTIAPVCERPVIAATGFTTVKSIPLEAPTPGLTTVMANVPVVFNCAAVIAAVNEVLLPNVVVSAVPAKCTTAPLTNSLPLTVSVNGVAPTIAPVCERPVIAATGFTTVKSIPLEAPTPGLTTVMANVLVVFNCVAVTAAVKEVLLPKVVVSAVPAKCTTAPSINLLPLTVSVNGV